MGSSKPKTFSEGGKIGGKRTKELHPEHHKQAGMKGWAVKKKKLGKNIKLIQAENGRKGALARWSKKKNKSPITKLANILIKGEAE